MQGTDKVLVKPKVITVVLSIIIGVFAYYQNGKDVDTKDFRERQLDKMDAFIAITGGLTTEMATANTQITHLKEGQAREEKQRDQLSKQVTDINQTLDDIQKNDEEICSILDGLSITYGWEHGCRR